ncbi:hypothetical protein [Longibacter sp.]|uniref:hypothetical protein n=1 Tax=Longibacter sp. TaxID=2045415 RepID=UPI003EBB79FF
MSASDASMSPNDAEPVDPDRLLDLVVETRAAVDVMLEMLALIQTDGSEDAYRETLDALQQHHRQTTEILRASLAEDDPA